MSTSASKSTTVAYLLWFFLGGFGAHRFYLGKTRSAFGMIGLSLGSAVLSVIFIGLLGYVALLAWWIYDATQIGKWVSEQSAGVPMAGESDFAPASPVMAPAPLDAEAA
ncbi:MAG: TM2 domain-containing protein [Phycisphaerales bacterium JB039]